MQISFPSEVKYHSSLCNNICSWFSKIKMLTTLLSYCENNYSNQKKNLKIHERVIAPLFNSQKGKSDVIFFKNT